MARRFTTEEAILDDDFGLSDGKDSEMKGEDIYGYCHGNFGRENFGPRDRNSTKRFRGIVVLSWKFSPPVNKCHTQIYSFNIIMMV